MACNPWKVDIWTTDSGKYYGSYFFSNKVAADDWAYDYNIINNPYGLGAGYSYFDMVAGAAWEKEQLRKMVDIIEGERNVNSGV